MLLKCQFEKDNLKTVWGFRLGILSGFRFSPFMYALRAITNLIGRFFLWYKTLNPGYIMGGTPITAPVLYSLLQDIISNPDRDFFSRKRALACSPVNTRLACSFGSLFNSLCRNFFDQTLQTYRLLVCCHRTSRMFWRQKTT